jgi:hypothetical protein
MAGLRWPIVWLAWSVDWSEGCVEETATAPVGHKQTVGSLPASDGCRELVFCGF